MAPIKSVTLRPGKKSIRRDSEKFEIVEDDNLSIRSIDTRDSRDEPFSTGPYDTPSALTPPPKLEGIEEGMRCEVAIQYRDRRGLYGWRTVLAVEEMEAEPPFVLAPNEEWLKQFAVIARKRHIPAGRGGSDLDCVRIRSPLLKPILRDLCKDYPGFAGHKAKSLFAMDMYHPFDGLFHCWSDLLRLEEEHANLETRQHIKLLHDLLEPQFQKPLKNLEECRINGNITFGVLWTIFKPGDLIYRKDDHDRECVERVDDMYYGTNSDRKAFKVESKMVCWDGQRFGYRLSCGWFYDFSGTMSLTDLAAVPLDFHPDRVAIKERMMKRGEKFQALAGCQLKAYSGPQDQAAKKLHITGRASDHTLQIQDRIIINPDGVGCPRMAIELEPLVKENPFDNLANDQPNRVSSPGSLRRSVDRRAATDLRKAREEWDSKRRAELRKAREETSAKSTTPAAKSCDKVKGVDALTDDQMLICVPDVACFDLTRKEWVLVDLNEIGDVAWNENLFDDLVWPADEKEILLAVAESYREGGEVTSSDIPDKKSRGTTIMIRGDTGEGRSFAVQTVAEKLHMPLYSISVGDMIRDFGNFETRLEETLERCIKWNAILLVRDLDFFFENTLEGTCAGATCATIVHHLEGHQGLVVLTCTTDTPFRPFLLAKIDLFLQIPSFATRQMTRQHWANALSTAVPLKDRHFTSEHLDKLAEKDTTGRQAKSAVKLAAMLARSKGSALKMEHLERVLNIKDAATCVPVPPHWDEDKPGLAPAPKERSSSPSYASDKGKWVGPAPPSVSWAPDDVPDF